MSDNLFQLNEVVMNDIVRYGKFNFNKYNDIINLNFEDYKKCIEGINFDEISICIAEPNKED